MNTDKWFVYDPDQILEIAAGATHLSAALEPREDLMLFKHKTKPVNIDFGFYGDEVTATGEWVVYVLNTSLDEPWDNPVDRLSSNSFVEGLKNIQDSVLKHT